MNQSVSKRKKGAKTVAQGMDDIYRELGRLAEAAETSKDERKEFRQAVDKLSGVIQDMRGDFRLLNQTMQSTATTIATLTADKCGQRLDVLETKTKHYDRVLGRANTFVWKMAGMVITSALTGAGVIKLVENL